MPNLVNDHFELRFPTELPESSFALSAAGHRLSDIVHFLVDIEDKFVHIERMVHPSPE